MPELTQFHLYSHQLNEEQELVLQRTISHFHNAQQLLELTYIGEKALPTENQSVPWHTLVAEPQPEVPEINITSLPLADHWFSHTHLNLSLITASDWAIAFDDWRASAPVAAPEAYLLQELTIAILLSAVQLSEEEVAHASTTGCVADMCERKPDMAIKLRSGFLCPICRKRSAEAGLSGVYLDAIQALLDHIRLLALGRSPQPQLPEQIPTDEVLTFISKAKTVADFIIPESLLNALREKNLTVLVGSGFSLQPDIEVKYAENWDWQKLPGWLDIKRRLCERTTAYLGRSYTLRETETLQEFLVELDAIRVKLGPERYYSRAIADLFLPEIRATGISNRLLFHLPLKFLLTTNYDFILNYAAPSGTATFTWKEARQAREYLNTPNILPPLVKLHGCASRVDTIILTSSEYAELNKDLNYKALTRQIFENHPVLFLGYGLNDPLDLDMALESAKMVGGAQGTKFALVQRNKAQAIEEKFPDVHALSYEHHEQVPNILAMLIRAAAATGKP